MTKSEVINQLTEIKQKCDDMAAKGLDISKENKENILEFDSCAIKYYPDKEAFRADHILRRELFDIVLYTDGDVDITNLDELSEYILSSEKLYKELGYDRKYFKDLVESSRKKSNESDLNHLEDPTPGNSQHAEESLTMRDLDYMFINKELHDHIKKEEEKKNFRYIFLPFVGGGFVLQILLDSILPLVFGVAIAILATYNRK